MQDMQTCPSRPRRRISSMSSTKGVGWLLPRASDETRQCAATEAATPTISSASAVAALLAVLCVLLMLRVLQLQRRLSRRHAATAKTTDFADQSDHPFWLPFHHYRTSSSRASSPKPVLTISVPQTPATPAIPEVVSAPTMIVVGGGAASDPWPLDDIEAYLIDLDGTIYSPSGPIDGAAEFYAAVLRHKPHVFLSNTGAKGADGVRQKLLRNGIIMGPKSQDRCIYTAAQAQCKYMADTIPPGCASVLPAALRNQQSGLVVVCCSPFTTPPCPPQRARLRDRGRQRRRPRLVLDEAAQRQE